MSRIVLTFALLGFAAIAQGAEPISGTLTTSPTGEVSITVVRGSVKVVGIDGDRVSVEGTRDHESEAFIFERDGDVVKIEDKLPKRTASGAGTQLTVQVPRDSRLRIRLVSADLEIADVRGAARFATVSGTVTARGLGSDTEASTVSGNMSIGDASGEVRLETVSGKIDARIAATRLSTKSVSGRVEVDNAQPLSRGRMATVSGHLSLTTPLEPDVDLEMETVSGHGTLTLSGPLDVRLNIVGGPGGDIRNRLDDTPVQRRSPGIGKRLETRLGEGRGYVRASTVSGTLTVAGS